MNKFKQSLVSIVALMQFFVYNSSDAQSPSPTTSDISQRGKVKLKRISKLPTDLEECSGIITVNDNRILAINDGGNLPTLYCIDSSGAIINTWEIRGAENVDWEDMASDDKNLYIGDVGNNMNKRGRFQIYKISLQDTSNVEYLTAKKIEFRYEDLLMPLPSHKLNYDVESLIVLNDTVYLFSKNRTRPFNGMVYIYQLPVNVTNTIATKYDSLYLGSGRMIDFWISSAALSPNKSNLVLISYSKMWIFNCIRGSSFFTTPVTSLDFEFTSQKESISFVNEHTLYLTDEKAFPFSEGVLYSLDIENYLIKDCR